MFDCLVTAAYFVNRTVFAFKLFQIYVCRARQKV